MSQSCAGVLATTLADTWQVAREIVVRAGGDPGFPGLAGPDRAPPQRSRGALAFLETGGMERRVADARQRMQDALARLRAAGIEILTRRSHAKVDAVETAIAEALPLSSKINAWESRWPLNTYRERDAGKLSRPCSSGWREAEAMTLDDYRAPSLAGRERARDHAALAGGVRRLHHACRRRMRRRSASSRPAIRIFAVPASLLGVPALSLPLLED